MFERLLRSLVLVIVLHCICFSDEWLFKCPNTANTATLVASHGSTTGELDLWIGLDFLFSPCKQIEENTNQEIKIKIDK